MYISSPSKNKQYLEVAFLKSSYRLSDALLSGMMLSSYSVVKNEILLFFFEILLKALKATLVGFCRQTIILKEYKDE